ncbi:hypothetical protein [Pseudoalteromonas 'SMAR']|uniref:hypothetical protein n=1 Tax=Pseudoalteromonas 'SMAR' TaxID=3416908 RepID=UPI003AF2EEC6
MRLTKEELQFIHTTLSTKESPHFAELATHARLQQQLSNEIRSLLNGMADSAQFSLVARGGREEVEFPIKNLSTIIDILQSNLAAPNIVDANHQGLARSWRTCPQTPALMRLSANLMPFPLVSISQTGGLINTFPYLAAPLQQRLCKRIAKLYLGNMAPLLLSINALVLSGRHQLAISFNLNAADSETLKAFILHHYVAGKGINL